MLKARSTPNLTHISQSVKGVPAKIMPKTLVGYQLGITHSKISAPRKAGGIKVPNICWGTIKAKAKPPAALAVFAKVAVIIPNPTDEKVKITIKTNTNK